MGKYSLVALDTQHIKQYVFPTDRLKEIRGASSLLDHLNRREMLKVANEEKFGATQVFANGGSALFLIKGDKNVAERFGTLIQQKYREKTGGGAALAFATQELPGDVKDVEDVWKKNIRDTLDLLYYRLEEASHSLLEPIVLPSHPLLRPCSACGVNYAEGKDRNERNDPAVSDNRYCSVCWNKRVEDNEIKKGIKHILREREEIKNGTEEEFTHLSYAWKRLIDSLPREKYPIPTDVEHPDDLPERPADFYELRGGRDSKEYLALIYADGNGMGQVMDKQKSLEDLQKRANLIDDAVYEALGAAVRAHLQIPPGDDKPRFPFDVLLVGGDDVLIVTRAAAAFDVALTLAQTFRRITIENDPKKKGHSLSIGVVLAPVSYPFGLLFDLAESTLKHAKKAGAKNAAKAKEGSKKQAEQPKKATTKSSEEPEKLEDHDSSINFMVVTGSTSQDFQEVYAALHEKHGRVRDHAKEVQFYATLRPYTVKDLTALLALIREGKEKKLGRTKLHQVREAVLKMNLTTSVTDGLGVLRNWQVSQREFVLHGFYDLGVQYQKPYQDDAHPETLFPRVTFPWFADGPDTYRTPLLDFVELYDFVESKGADNADEN